MRKQFDNRMRLMWFCCSLGEAAGREGKLEKSKKLFLEADGIFKEVLGVEYPFYRQQVYKKYVDISKESNEFVKY